MLSISLSVALSHSLPEDIRLPAGKRRYLPDCGDHWHCPGKRLFGASQSNTQPGENKSLVSLTHGASHALNHTHSRIWQYRRYHRLQIEWDPADFRSLNSLLRECSVFDRLPQGQVLQKQCRLHRLRFSIVCCVKSF